MRISDWSSDVCSSDLIRIGSVEVWIEPEELGFPIALGDIELSECEMINQFVGSKDQPAQFTRGYGLAFGHAERKAMGMALVERALRANEDQEVIESPAQQIGRATVCTPVTNAH